MRYILPESSELHTCIMYFLRFRFDTAVFVCTSGCVCPSLCSYESVRQCAGWYAAVIEVVCRRFFLCVYIRSAALAWYAVRSRVGICWYVFVFYCSCFTHILSNRHNVYATFTLMWLSRGFSAENHRKPQMKSVLCQRPKNTVRPDYDEAYYNRFGHNRCLTLPLIFPYHVLSSAGSFSDNVVRISWVFFACENLLPFRDVNYSTLKRATLAFFSHVRRLGCRGNKLVNRSRWAELWPLPVFGDDHAYSQSEVAAIPPPCDVKSGGSPRSITCLWSFAASPVYTNDLFGLFDCIIMTYWWLSYCSECRKFRRGIYGTEFGRCRNRKVNIYKQFIQGGTKSHPLPNCQSFVSNRSHRSLPVTLDCFVSNHRHFSQITTEPAKGHREKKIISCALDAISCERETISCALDNFFLAMSLRGLRK